MENNANQPPTQSKSSLNEKQELFCQFFVNNRQTRGNAVWSYDAAYGHEIEELSREPTKDAKGRIIGPSAYDKAYSTCGTNGRKLLQNTAINARITELRVQWLTDDQVDSELADLIQQSEEKSVRLGAIREYNALRTRVIKRAEVTGKDGKDLFGGLAELTDDQLRAIAAGTVGEASGGGDPS